jgi:hypothetical protein
LLALSFNSRLVAMIGCALLLIEGLTSSLPAARESRMLGTKIHPRDRSFVRPESWLQRRLGSRTSGVMLITKEER